MQYLHAQKLLDTFSNSVAIDLDTANTIDDNDIYIIEMNDASKEGSQKLVNLFKKKPASLIYFILPKNHSLMLFQLTFLLETKALITHSQDIDKTILKIKSDREAFVQNSLERWLGNIKIKTQDFIIYKNNHLIYVNKNLLSQFKCDNNHSFQTNILSQINIKELLNNDTSHSTNLIDTSKQEHLYLLTNLTVSENEKIIYFTKESAKVLTASRPAFMSSKVAFVELLKEGILQRNVSSNNLSLLTINITNIKTLLQENDIVQFEELLLDMLMYMESILENKLVFSQYENDFYVVLFENTNFDTINTIAESFHKKVLNYISHKENKVHIKLFTFDLKEQEFSTTLTTIEKLKKKEFTLESTNAHCIKQFTDPMDEINAKTLLNDAYNNKINLKILNIYNGLVVNTEARILKITNDTIYITFESLQGVVLNIEKQTVLQSDYFFQDIYAEVKQISFTKKIAILENFKFLKTNANSRKYARVTTHIKIPIQINTKGFSANGALLDLSIKSIAIQAKNIAKLPMVKPGKATLIFNLPSKTSEDGYTQLNIKADIIVVTPVDKTEHYKVICDLDQNSHYLDTILKYVYERQKELIIELKKMAKLN